MPRGTSEMGGRLPSFWSDSVRTTTSSGFTVATVHPVKWKTPISHEDPHHPPRQNPIAGRAPSQTAGKRDSRNPCFNREYGLIQILKNSIFRIYTDPTEKSTGVDNFFSSCPADAGLPGRWSPPPRSLPLLIQPWSRRIPVRRAAPPDSGRGRSRAPGSAAFAAAGAGSYDVRR